MINLDSYLIIITINKIMKKDGYLLQINMYNINKINQNLINYNSNVKIIIIFNHHQGLKSYLSLLGINLLKNR